MLICNILGSLRSLAIWFESYLVANSEHFFSWRCKNELAHMNNFMQDINATFLQLGRKYQIFSKLTHRLLRMQTVYFSYIS